MRVGPGLPVGQDVWSSRRTWATQDTVVPSSAHGDMLEGGKAARPLGRGGRGPRGFHQAASGSLPCSTQGLGPQCPPAWCRPTCDSEEGHRRHLGLGQGPRGRPGLGSEIQAVQWAGSLHPSRLLVEVVGGGSPACRRGSQELVLQGGHLSSPDAFCRKDFQPHKQALTRAGAETWPRRAAGPWVPGTAAEGRGSAGQRWPQAGSLGQDTASAPEPAGPSLWPQPGPGDQQTFCLSRVRGRDAGRVNVDTPERELLGHGSAWRWPCGVVGRPRVQGWGRPPSRL